MKKNTNRKWKIVRSIFKGLTVTSSAFVFQACYGTPNDFGNDTYLHGVVTSKITNTPISGIKVSLPDSPQYETTNADGEFEIYVASGEELRVRFEDVDAEKNGKYLSKDTVIQVTKSEIILDVKLDAGE